MPVLQALAYLSEALPVIEKLWQWYTSRNAAKITSLTTAPIASNVKAQP
jgi:hypothetical protein